MCTFLKESRIFLSCIPWGHETGHHDHMDNESTLA